MKQPIHYLYLAGGLFNAGESLHNLMLEKHLKMLGYTIVLPQREALKFRKKDGSFDLDAMAEDCRRHAANPASLCVANTDGADADSGTCVEYGVAMTAKGYGVVYRTDSRTRGEHDRGINSMLTLKGTTFVSHPCFFTELDEVEDYYKELALKLHEAIQEL